MRSPLRALLDPLARRRRLAAAYRSLFDSQDGQLVLKDLLKRAGMLVTSHEPGEAHDTAFNEGRRSMGIYLLERMHWNDRELVEWSEEQSAEAAAARGDA